jgi:hypothetical protein
MRLRLLSHLSSHARHLSTDVSALAPDIVIVHATCYERAELCCQHDDPADLRIKVARTIALAFGQCDVSSWKSLETRAFSLPGRGMDTVGAVASCPVPLSFHSPLLPSIPLLPLMASDSEP